MEEKLKVFNGKHITAACVLINPNGDILGCHATGRPKDRGLETLQYSYHMMVTQCVRCTKEKQIHR